MMIAPPKTKNSTLCVYVVNSAATVNRTSSILALITDFIDCCGLFAYIIWIFYLVHPPTSSLSKDRTSWPRPEVALHEGSESTVIASTEGAAMESPCSVLILDDDSQVREVIRRTLAKEGHQCWAFANPLTALAELRQRPHEVAIVDLVMPEMDGMAFLQALRVEQILTVPIMLTGYANVTTAVEALKHGAFDYLEKPFSLAALHACVQKAKEHFRLREREHDLSRLTLEWEATFNAFPDLVVVLDPETKVVRCNSAFADKIPNVDPSRFPQPLNEVCPPLAVATSELQTFQPSSQISRPNSWETQVFDSDFRVTVSRVPTADESMGGFIVVARDVTNERRGERALRESEAFLAASLDSLSAHIAVLDEEGTIIKVNKTWRDFADANSLGTQRYGVGTNYFHVCNKASLTGCKEATTVAQGIREILAGEREHFYLAYPCHSPDVRRWFQLRVTKFAIDDPTRVVVAHENITERKLLEETRRLLLARVLYVQEQEQRRLAREIHDGLGQRLTYLSMCLSTFTEDSVPDADTVQAIQDQVSLAIDETRRLVRGLRPSSLDQFGLQAALGKVILMFTEASGVEVSSQFEGFGADETIPNSSKNVRLPATLETVLFRVIQEGLTNIAKHAHANHVSLHVTKDEGTVVATLCDDGVGFDSRQAMSFPKPNQGYGLLGIRERVEMHGGTFSIRSSPQGGTTLCVRFALEDFSGGEHQSTVGR